MIFTLFNVLSCLRDPSALNMNTSFSGEVGLDGPNIVGSLTRCSLGSLSSYIALRTV